jgi:hypothetical protein
MTNKIPNITEDLATAVVITTKDFFPILAG